MNELLSTLSDPVRRDIFERIVVRPTRAEDIAAAVGVSHRTLHQHIRELRRAQLVSSNADGRLTADKTTLPSIRTYFDRLWIEASLGDGWISGLGADASGVS